PEYTHSQFRGVSTLEETAPEPLAEIHPETAKKYGISEGDMMTVETVKGKINMKARTTEDLIPGILSIPHGWANANANELTELEPRDPVTGYTEMKALLCRVSKAENLSKAA
ncbi:MAG: molybdopterin dinucleotide binding domain-containing protein, partial [Pseudomonadota bacterium]